MVDIKVLRSRAELAKALPANDLPPHGMPRPGFREEALREAIELLFFAYRDMTAGPDAILEEMGLGRAHHRAIHFIGRNPGITVAELLAILRISKQSLARVLKDVVERKLVRQLRGGLGARQVEGAQIGQYVHDVAGKCKSIIYTKGA